MRDAPDQGALKHRENDMRSKISKLDCLKQLTLSRAKSTSGLKLQEGLAICPEIKDKGSGQVFSGRREFLSKCRTSKDYKN